MSRRAIFATLAILFVCSTAAAQTAVVTRNVNLRRGPSSKRAIIETLAPLDELTILSPNQQHGYWEVRAADGEHGWVWAANVRVGTSDTAPPPPPSGATSLPEVFHGCGLEGLAVQERRKAANRQKNRLTAPASSEVEQTATIAAVLQTGPDTTRWLETQGASIVAYVVDVKKGSKETVNCGDTDLVYRDTHIDVVENPNDTRKIVRMIVEVTPRWRAFMAQQGEDWSTPTLKQRLLNHWVRFTGWLFWDIEHVDEAENTTPGRAANWRATAWEIHPVTEIKVCPGTPQTCD